MSTPYTPEPWRVVFNEQSDGATVIKYHEKEYGLDHPIAIMAYSNLEHAADSKRIVACVNACAGLNPEAVPELVAALEGLLASASPTEREHPRMFAAWKTAKETLLKAKQQ